MLARAQNTRSKSHGLLLARREAQLGSCRKGWQMSPTHVEMAADLVTSPMIRARLTSPKTFSRIKKLSKTLFRVLVEIQLEHFFSHA